MSSKSRIVFLGISVFAAAVSVLFGWASMVDVVQRAVRNKDSPPFLGAPIEWQLNFQFPHSPLSFELYRFHNFLLGINIAICAIVLALLMFTMWRFRRSKNPIPSRVTHNTALEVTWTVLPVLVLLAISVPSFTLLSRANTVPRDAEMTLKVTGHQWFWEYAYPDQGGFQFSSLVLPDARIPPDQKQLRLLLTDQMVVLPIDTVIRIQVTSADVIHSWAVPSLGLKKDAVPGRLNETWVKIDREGIYFGQCSVLCGAKHAYMPIAIQAMSKPRFLQWLEEAKKKFASDDTRLRITADAQ